MFTFISIVKMQLLYQWAICMLLSQSAWCYLKTYKDFKLYSISCESQSDIEVLKFWEHNVDVDFWSPPRLNKLNHILVDPSLQPEFEEFLSYENFNYEILIENVGKLVISFFCCSFRLFNFEAIKIFTKYFLRLHSSSTIESRMTNKLKFHFQNGNFTDSPDRDFSHYWLLPEVNLEKKIVFQSTDFLKSLRQFTRRCRVIQHFYRIWEWWTEWNQVRNFWKGFGFRCHSRWRLNTLLTLLTRWWNVSWVHDPAKA